MFDDNSGGDADNEDDYDMYDDYSDNDDCERQLLIVDYLYLKVYMTVLK